MAKKIRPKESPVKSLNPIETRPLQPTDWPFIEDLFGEKGACGGCWCMAWRVPKGGKTWEAAKGEPNRQAFKKLVESGEALGILAFADGRPVGWCSFGPAQSFPRMLGSRVLARDRKDGTWSITCFFILPAWRRCGLSIRLLEAAVRRAFELGATEVEGFPVPSKTDKRLPGAFVWTGVPAMFQATGFAEEADPPGERPIYVKRKN